MKLFYRSVLFVLMIIFLFLALILALYSFGLSAKEFLPEIIASFYQRWDLGLLSLVAFIAGAWIIYPFFIPAEGQKTRILQSDLGVVDISISALDNLVQDVAIQQEGVVEITNHLSAREDGLHIFLKGKVLPQKPLPELIGDLQKIVKSYIEDTTGVTVAEVKVLVEGIKENAGGEE